MAFAPKISIDDLQSAIDRVTTWSALARLFYANNAYGNVRTLKRYIKHYQLNVSHFNASTHSPNFKHKYTHDELFTENSPAPNTVLVKMYKRYYPPVECSECKVGTTWNKKPLTLHIDHVDGHATDWRLTNLRYLCPNCHYQTDTHGTKRGLLKRDSELKATPGELSEKFAELGCYKAVGLIFGMSDRTVKNTIRKYRKDWYQEDSKIEV